jgi:hypothetical protein
MLGAVFVFLALAAPLGTAALDCASDAACARVHAGVCWTAVGAGAGTCACAPWQSFRADLGTCEEPAENATAVTIAGLYYASYTEQDDNRYDATPLWPSTWTCDATRCTAADSDRAAYMVPARTLEAYNESTVLSPSLVRLWCGASTRRLRRVAYAPSVLLTNSMPLYESHCVSCDAWCGPFGSCDDPVTFRCKCQPGRTGPRCEHSGRATVLGTLAEAGAFAAPMPPVLRSVDLFHALMRASFPAYALDRGCQTSADCGTGEICYINVTTTAATRVVTRSCFCDTAKVPDTGAATGCSTVTVNPLFGLKIGATERNSIGLVTSNYTADGIPLMFLVLPLGTQAVTVHASDITDDSRALANPEPVLLLCSPLLSPPVPPFVHNTSDPAGWCDMCSERCNGQSCSGAGCVCDSLHAGPSCTDCAFSGLMPPVCNETIDGCRARLCGGNGRCTPVGTCVCDAGFVGSSCSTTITQCGYSSCNDNGLCDPSGACVCEAGWTGVACNITASECATRLCSGNGACAGTACVCNQGWTGPSCATRACVYGTQVDAACSCAPGYIGTLCNESLCGSGGVFDGTGCACTGVMRGPRCTEHVCGDGTPYQLHACACPSGYTTLYDSVPQCIPPVVTITPYAIPPPSPRGDSSARVAVIVLGYVAATVTLFAACVVKPTV